MSEWHLDIDGWPGPDRRKYPGTLDILKESPDGKHVAVVYSCGEVGIDKQVGRFALLQGPPDSPWLLLRPRRLLCFVYYDDTTAQWIGSRFCAVTPYRTRQHWSGVSRAFIDTLYLDVVLRRMACAFDVSSHEAVTELPAGLVWRSWRWLWLWPLIRHMGWK